MLCHSKVWSRVWTHRCNVNMNPYISVCPVSVSPSSPSSSCPAGCQSSFSSLIGFIFRQTLQKEGGLSRPSICPPPSVSSFPSCLSLHLSPLTALLFLFFAFLHITRTREPCSLFPGSLRCMRATVYSSRSCGVADEPQSAFPKDSLLEYFGVSSRTPAGRRSPHSHSRQLIRALRKLSL